MNSELPIAATQATLLRTSLMSLKSRFQAVADRGTPGNAWLIKWSQLEPGMSLFDQFAWIEGFSLKSLHTGITRLPFPVDNFIRGHQIIGEEQISAAAIDAARLLEGMPAWIWTELWSELPSGSSFPLGDGWQLWSEAVFELAWKGAPGSPLKASRWARIDANNINEMVYGLAPFQKLPADADWYSTLDNFAGASVHAINILLCWLEKWSGSPATGLDRNDSRGIAPSRILTDNGTLLDWDKLFAEGTPPNGAEPDVSDEYDYDVPEVMPSPDDRPEYSPSNQSGGPENPYRFACGAEIVQVHGFGEAVALEKTEGVERLIAIVTKRRVNVIELARIGAPQQDRNRSSVDIDADRLSERESANDERFESLLGDDAQFAVREAVGDLIAQRDAAAANGDDQEAGKLTALINAALQVSKLAVQAAAGTVRKSLDRTYDRLREGNHGITLANHFDQFITRPRGESDYVYAPDESHGKIDWNLK